MKQFFKLDAEIMKNPNLLDGEKMTYAVISSLSQELGYCWASNQHIADLTVTTTRNVQRRIKSLVDKNFCTVDFFGNQRQITIITHDTQDAPDTTHRTHYHDTQDAPDTTQGTHCHDTQDTLPIYSLIEKEKNIEYKTNRDLVVVDDGCNNKVNTSLDVIANSIHNPFLEFWCDYKELTIQGKVCRKGSKLNAEKAYKKVAHHHDDIMAGLKNYLKDCQDNSIYVKHASTFLNSRSWECDLKPPEAEVMNKRQRDEQERLKAMYDNDGRF